MGRKKKPTEEQTRPISHNVSDMAPVMGRPQKHIDKEQFEKLCTIQSTILEIAGWFHVSVDTIERWVKRTYDGRTFAAVRDEYAAQGKISLRRTMFQNALKGNTQLLVFLARNELGMSDSKILVPYNMAQEKPIENKPTEGKTRDELQGYIEAKLAGG